MLDKIISGVKGPFNIITIIEIFCAVIFFIVGISFFTHPFMSEITLSIITGLVLIIYGVCSIIYFIKRGEIILYNNNMIYGIILIIIGALALFLHNILAILLGIYLIILGFQRINYAILLKKYNEVAWLLTLVTGIMFIVVAIITFFASADTIVKVTGIYLMAIGLLVFINTSLLRQRSNYFIA